MSRLDVSTQRTSFRKYHEAYLCMQWSNKDRHSLAANTDVVGREDLHVTRNNIRYEDMRDISVHTCRDWELKTSQKYQRANTSGGMEFFLIFSGPNYTHSGLESGTISSATFDLVT